MYQNILNSTEHRQSPMPQGPWLMMQHWEHLLFLSWPLPPNVLKPYLPPGLELDMYDGHAWISVIPFRVSQIRVRGMPQIPFMNGMLEVNVRTYVTCNGLRGVYFFSLDADRLLAVLGARMLSLPYFFANISMKDLSGTIRIDSKRRGKSARILQAEYQPIGESFVPEKGSIADWLLERYFLWTYRGVLFRGSLHHRKWAVQQADVHVEEQSLTDKALGADFLAHYAASQIALIWMIRREPCLR